jgi:hypothetical protein
MLLRCLTLTGLLMFIAGLLSAADISGTWKGSFEYNGQPVPVTFQMKSSEGTVTGTVDGLPTPNAAIKDGKLDGDDLSFWIQIQYQGDDVKLVLKGKVSGDEIKFSMGTDDGSWSTDLTARKS